MATYNPFRIRRSADPRHPAVVEALHVLETVAAEDADYAKTQNGVGFSKSDSPKGHSFAQLSPEQVLSSDTLTSDVLRLAARYRRQASRVGQGTLL